MHAGRISSYSILGLLLGLFGQTLWAFDKLQAALSIVFAILAFYMASALIGLTPSPELLFTGVTRRWGLVIRAFRNDSFFSPFLLGLLWGFLPCGLILIALITAMSSGSALSGALNMLVFGTATIPSLIAVKWFTTRIISRSWSRGFTCFVMMLLGFQFTMRGFASLGLIDHFMLGSLMFW